MFVNYKPELRSLVEHYDTLFDMYSEACKARDAYHAELCGYSEIPQEVWDRLRQDFRRWLVMDNVMLMVQRFRLTSRGGENAPQ